MMDSPTQSTDHDLLIEVSTNVKNLTTSINTSTLATTQVTQDHEHRIRLLESSDQQHEGAEKSQRNQLTILGIVGALIDVAITAFIALKK
jgi:hypothetical protein